jgi:hypothetical protein
LTQNVFEHYPAFGQNRLAAGRLSAEALSEGLDFNT